MLSLADKNSVLICVASINSVFWFFFLPKIVNDTVCQAFSCNLTMPHLWTRQQVKASLSEYKTCNCLFLFHQPLCSNLSNTFQPYLLHLLHLLLKQGSQNKLLSLRAKSLWFIFALYAKSKTTVAWGGRTLIQALMHTRYVQKCAFPGVKAPLCFAFP